MLAKDESKTLLILSPGFAENEADTTCLPAQQSLVLGINKVFPSVRIIILAFQYPYSDNVYQWKGNTIIPFNGKNKGTIYRLLLWIKIWQRLSVLKKQYHVTGLLNFWYGECGLIGNLFGRRNNIKHFTWLLGQDGKKGNRYVKYLRPQPGELIALSDFLAEEFEKNYSIIPTHIIPIGIDKELYTHSLFERDVDILAAGSLISLKRYDIFIEVVKELKKKLPGIHAVLCGDGEEREKLERMIAEAGLQKDITITGEKPHNEVLKLMQRTKLFLHTSSYEGFGLVCLEALYAGAQVVSFCRPQNAWIRNWHYVNDTDEMIQLSGELLGSTNIDHSRVLPYSISETVRSVMQLFDHNEAVIS